MNKEEKEHKQKILKNEKETSSLDRSKVAWIVEWICNKFENLEEILKFPTKL